MSDKILDEKLICDVMLPPATIIKRGCDLRTLLAAINQRSKFPPAQRVLRDAALAQQPTPAAPDGFLLATPEQVERHATTAWECPPQSRVVLVSTLKRLHTKNTAAPAAPIQADHTALLAELYQILSAHDATEAVLDQVQAAIAGEPLPHASLLPYEVPAAYEPQDCKTCNGHGMVGGLRPDGYDGEICPACGGTCEQPHSTTSDRYRAELYDEVWSQACLIGFGNVTDALAELQRMKLAEQPDAVKVPRWRTRAVLAMILNALDRDAAGGNVVRGEMAAELRALLGKEGEA